MSNASVVEMSAGACGYVQQRAVVAGWVSANRSQRGCRDEGRGRQAVGTGC
jgi:hypothetical protein